MKVPPDKPRHASASYRLYIHLVWPTKYRKHVLGAKLTPVIESKILEVCETKQYQLFVARASVDHMHVLLGMRPTQPVSDVVRDLKSNSSAAAFATFSRLSEIIKMDVLWAEGYRAESVSPGDLQRVKRYIINQAEHHRASSNFEPGKMRNTSITARPRPGFRGHRPHETPTAHAVGIGCEFCCPTTGSRQRLGGTASRPYPSHIAVVRNASCVSYERHWQVGQPFQADPARDAMQPRGPDACSLNVTELSRLEHSCNHERPSSPLDHLDFLFTPVTASAEEKLWLLQFAYFVPKVDTLGPVAKKPVA